ncbi:MAG: hypothetical protein ABSC56_01630 [Solirubrobacteraceae bacterium]
MLDIAIVQRAREVGAVRARDAGSKAGAVRAIFAALACATVLASGASQADAATAPAGFFGVGGWSYPSSQQAATLSAAGLRLVRGALAWGIVQPSANPASRNWSDPDSLANEAAQGHFNIVFDLNGCAVWACGTTLAAPTGANLSLFEDFVRAAVARYEPSSSFWKGKASVPTITWQVWNEVNGGYFWPNPTPAAYAAFLGAISQTIRSVDPSASVIMSGLTGLPGTGGSGGVALVPFLQGLFQQPGFVQSTDAIVVHGYAADPASSLAILDEARRVMLANNDAAQPMWVTEMGWASAGPVSPFTVTPDTQATYLTQSWDQMLACAPRWNLAHVLWFSLQDISASVFGTADYWGYNSGLIDTDGNAKPAYWDFLQFIGSQQLPDGEGDTCTLAGGLTLPATSGASESTPPPGDANASGARIAILSARSLTNNRRYEPVRFAEVLNGKVVARVRFQCSLNGHRWQACRSPFNAASTHQGENSLSVRAVRAAGGPSPASVSWLVALTPPHTDITSFATSPNASNVFVASFTAVDLAGIAGYQCRVDGGSWQACSSPFTTRPLRAGRHSLSIRAIDRAGNRQRHATWLEFWVR